jgi:protein phosphatase
VTTWAITDIGRVRKRNEDCYGYDEGLGIFVVADGMGGHEAGDLASKLAVETCIEHLRKRSGKEPMEEVFFSAFQEANRRVFEESLRLRTPHGMGTTLTAIWFPPGEKKGLIGHVGDSRGYKYFQGTLTRLTQDHSWVQQQINLGYLTEEEALLHPYRNVITRSIGFEPEIEPEIRLLTPEPSAYFFLCTDGITGKITDKELALLFQELEGGKIHPEEFLTKLVDLANLRGGDDNSTALLFQLTKSPSPGTI